MKGLVLTRSDRRRRCMPRCFVCYLLFMQFALSATPGLAVGDVVFYRLPTQGGGVVPLEGTTTVNPGGSVTFQHPKFGKVYFDLASVEIKKAPTLTAQFSRMLGRAGNDAEKRMA